MERHKNKMSFIVNFLLFIFAVTALILLRVYITEPHPPAKFPSVHQIEQFMDTLDGDYYLDMDLLQSRTHIYSATVKRPMVVVEPASEEDIQKILGFVHGYPTWPFSVKSGGHSPAAYSLNNNGLVLDISKSFRSINWGDPDRTTIVIGSGANYRDIYQFLSGSGKGIVGAGCNSVGIGGYMQGGGNGAITAMRGLAIDSLVEASIILANGTKAVVSEETHQDLFWALRGGGGGNFGVVTSYKMNTFDMPTVSVVSACWNNEMTVLPSIIENFAPNLRDKQADKVWGFSFARLTTRIYFCILAMQENTTDEDLKNYMMPFIPNYDDLQVYNFTSLSAENDSIPVTDNDFLYIKSMILDSDAFDSDMNQILANALTIMRYVPIARVSYEPFGIATNRISKSDTAFPHRDRTGLLQLKVAWPKQYDSLLGSAVRGGANELWRQLTPWSKGAYVNYIDPAVQNWPQNYYGDNYDRLKSIKSEVDPTNFFHFDQSIGSQ